MDPKQVEDLTKLLHEIRVHAAATESQLWDIDAQLKNLKRKSQTYEQQIIDRHGEAVLARYLAANSVHRATNSDESAAGRTRPNEHRVSFVPTLSTSTSQSHHGPTRSGYANGKGEQEGAEGTTTDEQMLELQNQSLRRKLQHLLDELHSDQAAKVRLLEAVSYRLHGVPKMTLADHAVYTHHPSSLSPAVAGFLRLLKALPEGNAEALKRNRYFEFCSSAMRESMRQWNRMSAIDVEACTLKAVQDVGFTAKSISALASISLEDMKHL